MKFLSTVWLAVTGFFLTVSVHAASLLPVGALDGVETDAIDTVTDISTKMIPIVIGIMVAWAILSFVKKGFGKAGIK